MVFKSDEEYGFARILKFKSSGNGPEKLNPNIDWSIK